MLRHYDMAENIPKTSNIIAQPISKKRRCFASNILLFLQCIPNLNNMSTTHYEIILYVSDQKRSRAFYASIFQKEPVTDVPGMTEFELSEGLKLGLMPEDNIVKILGDSMPQPSTANGIPRCELYILTDTMEEDFARAIKTGAREISPIAERNWGHLAGYVADADGHIIAFAKACNPS